MEIKYGSATGIKSIEDYVTVLITALISLKTLESFHIKAVDIGILKEDQQCRANTMIWDFKRMMKLHGDQVASLLELLPEDFCIEKAIESLKRTELTRARAMTRKPRTKINDNQNKTQ